MSDVAATFLSDEHQMLRQTVRRFVQERLAPHVDAWEREKSFPRGLYAELGEAGLMGAGFPEQWGGAGGDLLHLLVVAEELVRSGSPGLAASLGSHCIAAPPILYAGSTAQKEKWLPPILRGKLVTALAVTEPDAGSDVASIRTRATRDGDHYVVNGAKTFITSGTRADVVTTVVRTGDPGYGGISLLLIETDRPGFKVDRNLEKMGWHASDTAELSFDNVRVPAENLLGEEGAGFAVLMQNFAAERLLLAVSATEIAQMAFDASLTYVQQRRAFGKTLSGFQVTRHKLAEMATAIDVCRTYNYAVASLCMSGEVPFQQVAMAKNASTDMASRVVDQAVQLHGGYGYMREYLVERLYRDVRLYPIGGGTREVMNEIISKGMGL